jgi:hypothetical protein
MTMHLPGRGVDSKLGIMFSSDKDVRANISFTLCLSRCLSKDEISVEHTPINNLGATLFEISVVYEDAELNAFVGGFCSIVESKSGNSF